MNKIIETSIKTDFWGNSYKTKKIKDEFFKSSYKISKSKLAQNESNDCVVRAFMVALDITYNQSHAWVKKYLKREDRKGTYTYCHLTNILDKTKNKKKITFYGKSPNKHMSFPTDKVISNPRYKKPTTYTVQSFMADHPTGRYFIIVERHALALVDGVLWGNPNEQFKGFRRRIHYVLKIG